MATRFYSWLLLFSVLCAMALLAGASGRQSNSQTAQHSSTAANNQDALGEKKFRTYCGRCHNAPQQLSPAIAGSVLRHMRVRAMLTREDEQQILRYLAP